MQNYTQAEDAHSSTDAGEIYTIDYYNEHLVYMVVDDIFGNFTNSRA